MSNPPSRSTRNAPVKAPEPTLQDHLFISYAWEDAALSDWLVRRLTAEGYRVWCDRFKLLGGEPFPKAIDAAIKTRTFRVIALLSRHSLNKPNPRKERTLALSLGRERGTDFMIPLNVDGLRPTDLPWDYSDLNYIAFQNWAVGLEQLLKDLDRMGAPRPLPLEKGRQIAADTFLPHQVLIRKTETLYTNCLSFVQVPELLRVFRVNETFNPAQLDSLAAAWPCYTIGERHLVGFTAPPAQISPDKYEQIAEVRWSDTDIVEGARSRDIVSNLLRQFFARTMIRRGLKRDPDSGLIYFPSGVLPKNKIYYRNRAGRAVWVYVVGQRKFRGQVYRYHLAPSFRIRQDLCHAFVAQLKIRVFLTDLRNQRLDKGTALARRKHLASAWFNHHWLSRVLAVCSFLADGKEHIALGEDEPASVLLEPLPIMGEVPVGINEQFLRPLREALPAQSPDWEDGSGRTRARISLWTTYS